MSANSPVLDAFDITAGYGASDILSSVTLRARPGHITTIAGPNGAGKSTLVKVLAGLLQPRAGRILIRGHDITALPPAERARAGLGYVPQERNVFRSLSIAENLQIGFEFIRPGASRRDFVEARDRVLELFPDLAGRLGAPAGTLSGGQRQMLAMGCALISQPVVLLLDEPSAGLSPRYVATMLDAVARINRTGVSVLMVEQNLVEAMRISGEAILLVGGRIKGTWDAAAFLADSEVRSLFLGGTPHRAPAHHERIADGASAA